jgi:hypothetical protein
VEGFVWNSQRIYVLFPVYPHIHCKVGKNSQQHFFVRNQIASKQPHLLDSKLRHHKLALKRLSLSLASPYAQDEGNLLSKANLKYLLRKSFGSILLEAKDICWTVKQTLKT